MTPKLRAPVFVAFLVLAAGIPSVFAGDSVYGTVTAVNQTGEVVTLNYGAGTYDLRIAGIAVDPSYTVQAKQLVEQLVLGKGARMRLVHRETGGEMISEVLTGPPHVGTNLAVQLLRAGFARRVETYDYSKYGELKKAEDAAGSAMVGIWAVR
jgi:endonuclease YncB( thermonuclease family)